MIKAIFLDSISDLFFQIFFIFSLFLNFEDIFKKCEFLYVSDLKRAKIWKYFEKVWVPVHYCSYIYQQGTYKISHQVIFDKFWLLLWKGASSCMFLALLLLTWNIQEHTLFGEKVWVLVCSCQTHIDCRNIQELTPFHKKFSEKVWVPVRSWPIANLRLPQFFILCRSFLLHAMIPRNHFYWNSNNFGNSTKDGTLNLRENLVQRFWWSRSTISIKNRWRYWSFFTAIYGIFSS